MTPNLVLLKEAATYVLHELETAEKAREATYFTCSEICEYLYINHDITYLETQSFLTIIQGFFIDHLLETRDFDTVQRTYINIGHEAYAFITTFVQYIDDYVTRKKVMWEYRRDWLNFIINYCNNHSGAVNEPRTSNNIIQ